MKEEMFSLGNMTEARISDCKQALMLGFATDTEKMLFLEVPHTELKKLLTVLYRFAQIHGEHEPPTEALPDVPLHDVLMLPTEELSTRTTPEGALWFVTRVGHLTTGLALPDAGSAQRLGLALLAGVAKSGG